MECGLPLPHVNHTICTRVNQLNQSLHVRQLDVVLIEDLIDLVGSNLAILVDVK